jgi:tRNA(fMet)-specific endonuclease VapC
LSALMLDTNCLISLVRATPKQVTERYLAALASQVELRTSVISLFEFRYGMERSQRHALQESALESLLTVVAATPFEQQDAARAATLKAILADRGTPIGGYDLLIAGQALARGWTVVTANTREFARVPGLTVEDWSRPV